MRKGIRSKHCWACDKLRIGHPDAALTEQAVAMLC